MDKVFTAAAHVAWLREQVRLKRPYWYGCYYNKCTEALLQRKAKQYPKHYTAGRMDTYRKHIAAGQIAGDCVNGAIKGAVWSELGRRDPVYGSHGCPDRSADGMFAYCKSVGMEYGTIDSMPDRPGVAVRYSGHVGVYVGNGEVVEWRGFAHGCVLTRLKYRKWTHWYALPWTDYGAQAEQPEAEKAVDVGSLGSRLLKKGRKGEDVRTLQELLMELGYALPKYGADGDFGSETKKAVKDFQQDNGLTVDGQYGEKSHAALMGILAEREAQEDEDGEKETVEAVFVEITGGTVNVRNGAGTQHDIVTVVRKGTVCVWRATAANGWHAVILPGGREGWVGPKYSKVV